MAKGCGCQTGIFKWLKPPYAEKFKLPCILHDNDYDKGGDEEDRRIADIMLYWRILKVANKTSEYPLESTWFALIAFLYYISVRIFGRFYFNYIKH